MKAVDVYIFVNYLKFLIRHVELLLALNTIHFS